ncbi:hypothetical protein LCGC14_0911090 [marine sediment metagenome]|uniref:Uncharacterized protein n=1 Tax=marine sediment metagenome TaxID=412755 RepID=A0A0F9S0I0_9ZZZZ|nr:hypothetical protein [Candidatus Aminicenantes bacterium]
MNEKTSLVKIEPTYSQRFTSMVVKEFSAQVGKLQLTPYQEKLAQHMFVAIDAQLKSLEAKRLTDKSKKDMAPIVWENINMAKLAIDAAHRVELGLDALIPNHIHPIPYLNSRTKLYDLDLRVGYVGKDCYKRKMSLNPPTDIIYQLVYGSDEFIPMMKSHLRKVETYEFNIKSPFQRGEVIGGFGYIIYENPEENKLIMVSKADFDKSKKAAQSNKFWDNHPREMQYKTLVHRTLDKIQIDPEKVNKSFLEVELGEAEAIAAAQIEEGANKETIDIEHEKTDDPAQTVEERKADGGPSTIEPEIDEDEKIGGEGPDF